MKFPKNLLLRMAHGKIDEPFSFFVEISRILKKMKFFQKNFEKRLDKSFQVCYNIIVVRRYGRQNQIGV